MSALEQELHDAETHLQDMLRATNEWARYCRRLHAQVRDSRLNRDEWITYLDGLTAWEQQHGRAIFEDAA